MVLRCSNLRGLELDYSPDSCLLADMFFSLGPRSMAPLLKLISEDECYHLILSTNVHITPLGKSAICFSNPVTQGWPRTAVIHRMW